MGNGDAQHQGIALDVETVLQAQRGGTPHRSIHPPGNGGVWSRNCLTRSVRIRWSYSSYTYMNIPAVRLCGLLR